VVFKLRVTGEASFSQGSVVGIQHPHSKSIKIMILHQEKKKKTKQLPEHRNKIY
jgi:hypothetical protein